MSASSYEVIATIAKEILIKALESNNTQMWYKNDNIPEGIDLATHLGDCYKTLHDKVSETIKA